MTNGYAKYHLRWVKNNKNEEVIFSEIGESPSWKVIPLEDGLGIAKLKTQKLGLGITIFHWKFSLTEKAIGKKIELFKMESTYPERALAIASAFGGTVGFLDSDLSEECLVGPDTELFRLLEGVNTTISLYGSPKIELIHFRVSERRLKILLGDEATSKLYEALELKHPPYCHLQKTSLNIRAPLYSAIQNANIKQENIFFPQIKIIEYLTSLISKSSVNSGRDFNAKLDKATEELHRILSSADESVEPLLSLAKANNVSPRILDAEFKKRFNLSSFAYTLCKGLDDAHLELSSKDTPLKVISANLGYKHVNHFSAAFKKKFGYSPSKLRK